MPLAARTRPGPGAQRSVAENRDKFAQPTSRRAFHRLFLPVGTTGAMPTTLRRGAAAWRPPFDHAARYLVPSFPCCTATANGRGADDQRPIPHRVRQGPAHAFAPAPTTREVPGSSEPEAPCRRERAHAGALMRINHVGEVCAQALYQGQALTSRSGPFGRRSRKAAARKPNIWPGPSAAWLNWVAARAC
jgi:hypothetical protein